MRTIKMSDLTKREGHTFWDITWSSEKYTKETEMLDRHITRTSVEFSHTLLGDLNGKKLLEIGCGSGYEIIDFYRKGAHVTAIDLAIESVKTAKELCKKNNIKSVHIKQMNAESLQFEDNTFDRVYINKVLLHTEKGRVLQECIRVLKKDGVLVLNEMLKNWLFAFPYRTFSPYRKSHPIYMTLREIKNLNAEHKEFYLFSTFFLFLFYIGSTKIAYSLFNIFARIDTIVLDALPFLRNFAWITVAAIRK